jgi:hypothetical protein
MSMVSSEGQSKVPDSARSTFFGAKSENGEQRNAETK